MHTLGVSGVTKFQLLSLYTELQRRNVLRVAAAYIAISWLLIQVVGELFPLFELSDAAARYVVTALAVGFVPAVIVAWAFEWTPQGLKRDTDIEPSQSIAQQTGKTLDRIIMVVLALALSYFAFDKFVLDPARDVQIATEAAKQARSETLVESYGDKSIAVLPFVNMSPDPDQAYFADGISEELLNLLAKIPELRVISRSSAFSFRGDDINIPNVAEQLNVAHVLEGSVRKAGNQIRITVQLIEARSDTHIWSETYDRTLDDIFAIQDEIAAEVVDQLKLTLLGDSPKTIKVDPEAYTLFLQAAALVDSAGSDVDDLPRVVVLLERALALEPEFSRAWSALSRAYYRMQFLPREEVSDALRKQWPVLALSKNEIVRLTIETLETALALDPDDGVANAYMGWHLAITVGDLEAGARFFERASVAEPSNVDVLRTIREFSIAVGRPNYAIAFGEYAVSLDPLCIMCAYLLARPYMYAGRLDEAETAIRNFQAVQIGGNHTLGTVLLLKGDAQAALELIDTQKQPLEFWLSLRSIPLYELGRLEESDDALNQFIQGWGSAQPDVVATVYAWRDDADAAFMWLDKIPVPEHGFSGLHGENQNPLFKKLHNDPRWQALLEKHSVSDAQLAAINFKPKLPPGVELDQP